MHLSFNILLTFSDKYKGFIYAQTMWELSVCSNVYVHIINNLLTSFARSVPSEETVYGKVFAFGFLPCIDFALSYLAMSVQKPQANTFPYRPRTWLISCYVLFVDWNLAVHYTPQYIVFPEFHMTTWSCWSSVVVRKERLRLKNLLFMSNPVFQQYDGDDVK